MAYRVTARSFRVPIADDIGEMVCFYNPYVRRFYCFQFAYVDRFFRIVRYIRRFCICITCTASSVKARHWSKNIYSEVAVCHTITDKEYKDIRSVEEFTVLWSTVEQSLRNVCQDFYDGFVKQAPLEWEVAGYELRIHRCYTYGCVDRVEEDMTIRKTRCFDMEEYTRRHGIETVVPVKDTFYEDRARAVREALRTGRLVRRVEEGEGEWT